MVSRNALIIAGSILFGIIVWFSAAMKEEYQVVVAAPLTIENIPADRSISTPVPAALQLKLRGSGWQLGTYLWGSGSRLAFPVQMFHGVKHALTLMDVAERIGGRTGIQLLGMTPDSVYVELDRLGRKTVPVVFDYQVSFKDGYGQVGPVQVVPESVAVAGAVSVLKNLEYWPTVHASFEDVKGPIETTLPLASSTTYMLTPERTSVGVKIEVEPFAERTLGGIPVEVVAAAPDRELILIPPKIDVVVRGGIRQLASLQPEDVHVSVNYRNVVADSSGMIDADISAPTGIQVVSRKPEHLQYVVRKKLLGILHLEPPPFLLSREFGDPS